MTAPYHEGELAVQRRVGVLAIDLETWRRMRINGRVRAVGPPLTVDVAEVYANCPKYIQSGSDEAGD